MVSRMCFTYYCRSIGGIDLVTVVNINRKIELSDETRKKMIKLLDQVEIETDPKKQLEIFLEIEKISNGGIIFTNEVKECLVE